MAPQITVENRERVRIAVQVYSAACEYKVESHFQHIPNFTHANGLCNYRNWFHMKQLQDRQDAIAADPLLLFAPDVEVGLTDHKSNVRLDEWVGMTPHSYKRSYHAVQDYGTCPGDSILAVYQVSGTPATHYMLLHPTTSDRLTMCDLRVFPPSGFLLPITTTLITLMT